jgi:UDP-N-acetylmuramate--alanine ligase
VSTPTLFSSKTRIHFVGIGGIGMSGIAEVLVNLGFPISGSDERATSVTARLSGLGVRVDQGHREANVAGVDVVVVSSAVPEGNVEIGEARRRLIPVIPRAEMLAELMRLKYGIAVAGSHGKTSTTSMIAVILDRAGLDPTLVIGGRVAGLGASARLGRSDFMVVEADESDRSFLHLSPVLAVVTNIDREHMDTYRDLENLKQAFVDFANKVPFYGAAVVCLDEPLVRDVLPRIKRRQVTYGFSAPAELTAEDVAFSGLSSEYRLRHRGVPLGAVRLRAPGRHAVLNSLAAAGVGLELGVAPSQVMHGIESFSGVDRRFQVKGEPRGVLVVDDYGHHPTEIRATLAAAKEALGRRTVVVFQPHRFSRVQDLFEEFCRAFHQADVLWVTDVYAAGEAPRPGVTGEALAQGIRLHGHRDVRFAPELAPLAERLLRELRPGDLVMTLGAGSVTSLSDRLLELLSE